ncbi:NADPH-dependent F420 reductase [Salana multivorans]
MRAPLVGVIGSGNIGAGVARMAAGAGLGVVLANSRGPDSLTDLVSELGDLATADTVEGAVTRARLVVLAIPFGALSLLPGEAFDGAVVLDATNYYPDRDGHVAELDGGLTTSSEAIAARLPGTARVVKGLNNVDFLRLTQLPAACGIAGAHGAPDRGRRRRSQERGDRLLGRTRVRRPRPGRAGAGPTVPARHTDLRGALLSDR